MATAARAAAAATRATNPFCRCTRDVSGTCTTARAARPYGRATVPEGFTANVAAIANRRGANVDADFTKRTTTPEAKLKSALAARPKVDAVANVTITHDCGPKRRVVAVEARFCEVACLADTASVRNAHNGSQLSTTGFGLQ